MLYRSQLRIDLAIALKAFSPCTATLHVKKLINDVQLLSLIFFFLREAFIVLKLSSEIKWQTKSKVIGLRLRAEEAGEKKRQVFLEHLEHCGIQHKHRIALIFPFLAYSISL